MKKTCGLFSVKHVNVKVAAFHEPRTLISAGLIFTLAKLNVTRLLYGQRKEDTMGATVKEERIEIRLASAEKDRIRQAAILSHQNVSEFVLRAVRTVADETLASQTRFVLPEEQMNAFYAALINRPN